MYRIVTPKFILDYHFSPEQLALIADRKRLGPMYMDTDEVKHDPRRLAEGLAVESTVLYSLGLPSPKRIDLPGSDGGIDLVSSTGWKLDVKGKSSNFYPYPNWNYDVHEKFFNSAWYPSNAILFGYFHRVHNVVTVAGVMRKTKILRTGKYVRVGEKMMQSGHTNGHIVSSCNCWLVKLQDLVDLNSKEDLLAWTNREKP